jgi:hypothetical protein
MNQYKIFSYVKTNKKKSFFFQKDGILLYPQGQDCSRNLALGYLFLGDEA